jgi:drug/metabolite transporter (DMT)-like permease
MAQRSNSRLAVVTHGQISDFATSDIDASMTVLAEIPRQQMSLASRFWQQPYLLLTLTSLFWAGNLVLGRFVAGHVPPVMIGITRVTGAMLILLPFAWPHLVRDWPLIRRHLPFFLLLAFTGFSGSNVLSYFGLQYTQALNALLLQSANPLIVAIWALIILRVRLTWPQAGGIAVSMLGVLTIVLRGDFATLTNVNFNIGDILMIGAMFLFGIYSSMMKLRPPIHQLSVLTFCFGMSTLFLAPALMWEMSTGYIVQFDAMSVGSLLYAMIFPSIVSYLFFNRGIQLVGPNRAAPFLHLMPVFGSAMAILLLGEKLQGFHLAGYVLVLIGIFIASRRRSSPIAVNETL